ncbi:MAG: hypothetical protein GEU26_16100 [Nitrososphaeraceae archaeon]|nr:hypothetical protein [Nitrososphaeraceae archaeon]
MESSKAKYLLLFLGVQRIFSVLYEWGSISSNTPIATPTPTSSELTAAFLNKDEDGNAVRPRMDTYHP